MHEILIMVFEAVQFASVFVLKPFSFLYKLFLVLKKALVNFLPHENV